MSSTFILCRLEYNAIEQNEMEWHLHRCHLNSSSIYVLQNGYHCNNESHFEFTVRRYRTLSFRGSNSFLSTVSSSLSLRPHLHCWLSIALEQHKSSVFLNADRHSSCIRTLNPFIWIACSCDPFALLFCFHLLLFGCFVLSIVDEIFCRVCDDSDDINVFVAIALRLCWLFSEIFFRFLFCFV